MRHDEGFDRRLGALLGTFVGDALGMPFEGAPPRSAPDPLELLPARLGRGTYTDDTEMMIALAEVLAEAGECDEERLASEFLQGHDPQRVTERARSLSLPSGEKGCPWRRRPYVYSPAARTGTAPRCGSRPSAPISPTTRNAFSSRRPGARASPMPTRSESPVRWRRRPPSAPPCARRSRLRRPIRVTNEPALGEALDRAVAAVLAEVPPEDIASALGAGASALESVPAALCAAQRARSFEDACTYAVQIGGDADTIAAMAGAVAGARFGASAIPDRWLVGLEEGARGRSYVEGLAEKLWPPAREPVR